MAANTGCFLTVADVADQLRVKTDTVLALIHAGQLAAVNVAGPGCVRPRWRVSPDALELFVAMRTKQKPTTLARRRRQKNEHVIEFFR